MQRYSCILPVADGHQLHLIYPGGNKSAESWRGADHSRGGEQMQVVASLLGARLQPWLHSPGKGCAKILSDNGFQKGLESQTFFLGHIQEHRPDPAVVLADGTGTLLIQKEMRILT